MNVLRFSLTAKKSKKAKKAKRSAGAGGGLPT